MGAPETTGSKKASQELKHLNILVSSDSMFSHINNFRVVRLLLEAGIDPNSSNEYGETPLIRAATRGYVETIEVLLDHKVDVNKTDHQNQTALMAASSQGNLQVVKILLKNGADVNQVDREGRTALINAAENENDEVIKQLLEYGADVNAITKMGNKSLMIAAEKGNTQVVKNLLKMGANVNQGDKNGWTALMNAAKNENDEVIKELLEYGADVNAKTDIGFTSLMIAASRGRSKNVETLIEHGADVNAELDGGPTALTMAEMEAHRDIVKILLDKGAKIRPRGSISSAYKEGASGESIIEGKITFKGEPPAPKMFDFEKFSHTKYCSQFDSDGKGHRILREVTVNKGKLQDVVVYIRDITKGKPFVFNGTDVIADHCRFLVQGGPSTFVGVVVKGAEFRVLNNDADPTNPKTATGVLYNPHLYEENGSSSSTIFNLPLPDKGQMIKKLTIFRKRDSVLHLQADSPSYMNAYFYPVENPYYAIVGIDGTYAIDQVPPGKYKLIVWHPILGIHEKEIEVAKTGKVRVDFEFSK